MCQAFLRKVILSRIEERGRAEGAPIVNFPERTISIEGEDMYVGQGWLEWLFVIGGFFLALPPHTYGVVVYPDGTARNLQGGMYENVPAGVYRVHYVDNHERTDVSAPVSEITTDGEKLTLRIIVRYRVINPAIALGIANPIETMMEHIETDVAQYIRTNDHGDIADSSDKPDSKLFAFFSERHSRRIPLSQAISIIGVELKEFAGDRDYVEMRRKERMDERQIEAEKKQEELQQELNRLKVQYRVENEKIAAEHSADLERNAAEHSAALQRSAAEHRAEKEKIEAHHEKEKQDIMIEVQSREIDLDNKRGYLKTQAANFSQVIEAITQAFSSGIPMNSSVIKNINDLFAAYQEDMDRVLQFDASAKQKPPANEGGTPPPSPKGSDKVEKLTHTLLNLLNPKK
jgi:hypothetical protein